MDRTVVFSFNAPILEHAHFRCIASLRFWTSFSCTRTKFWHGSAESNPQFDPPPLTLHYIQHTYSVLYSCTVWPWPWWSSEEHFLIEMCFLSFFFGRGGYAAQDRCSALPPSQPIRFSWYDTQHPHVTTRTVVAPPPLILNKAKRGHTHSVRTPPHIQMLHRWAVCVSTGGLVFFSFWHWLKVRLNIQKILQNEIKTNEILNRIFHVIFSHKPFKSVCLIPIYK